MPVFPRISLLRHFLGHHLANAGLLLLISSTLVGTVQAGVSSRGPIELDVEDRFTTISEARALERRVIELIDEVLPAIVGLEIIFQGTQRQGSIAGGSGTIIDLSRGLILTSGHVGRASGLPVKVYLNDGTVLNGETLGQYLDGQEDCGLVKVDPQLLADLPDGLVGELPLGDSDQVEKGDWVLAFGHTHGIETRPWRPPPARIGRITGNHDYVLTMDAPLNSGDSGGPTVDLKGRLIGINESCAQHPYENATTAVNVANLHFDNMLQGISGGATLPRLEENLELLDANATTNPIIFQPANMNAGRNETSMRRVLEAVTDEASEWTVRLFTDGQQVAYGLVVDESGLAVTKASEIDPRETSIMVGTSRGLLEGAKPLAIDRTLDLLLLQLPEGDWTPAPLEGEASLESGALVISAGTDRDPIAFGITQLDEYESDLSILDRAFLGISFQDFDEGVLGALVRGVVGGTAADRAGIRRGDVITMVDGTKIIGPNGISNALGSLRAGSVVELVFFREGVEQTGRVRLGSRAEATDEYATGNDEIRVSRHDTGFGAVIQHDGLVRPEECGSALIDLDGNLVGMNIARNDRTRTFALPVAIMRASIENMRSGGGRVKVWQVEDPRRLQVPLGSDEQGEFLLQASDAQLFGPDVRFERSRRGRRSMNSGYITGIDSTRDEVLWVLDDPEPGVYQVRVRQSCAAKYAGTKYVFETEGDRIESAAMPTRGWGDFRDTIIGTITLPDQDAVVISLAAIEQPRDTLFLLSSVELVPVRGLEVPIQ